MFPNQGRDIAPQDFYHQPQLSPIVIRWRRASHLLGSTRMRRRKTTIQMWKFAQENALLGNTPISRPQKANMLFVYILLYHEKIDLNYPNYALEITEINKAFNTLDFLY